MPFPAASVTKVVANVVVSQTDSVLVAAVSGSKIRVLSVVMQAGGTATAVTFLSKGSGSGTAISPLFALGANQPLILPFKESGWFDTNAGEGLTVTTGTGATTGFLIEYTTMVDAGNPVLDESGNWLTTEDGEPLLLE